MTGQSAGQSGDSESESAPRHLFEAASARLNHLVELAAAEARLATMSGLSMLLLTLFAGAALVIAWGLLVASAIYLLAGQGVPWPAAAVAFAFAHAGLAYACWRVTTRLSSNLTLPETRRAVVRRPAAGAPVHDEQGSIAHAQ